MSAVPLTAIYARMHFLCMVCHFVPLAFRHAAGPTTSISTGLAQVAGVVVTAPCPLASPDSRWLPSSQHCGGCGAGTALPLKALNLGSQDALSPKQPESQHPFPVTLSKRLPVGLLTFLKCVADCTFLTGCMRESRTMTLMSAPE